MKGSFRWKSLGFTIKIEGNGKVDINSFSDVLSQEKVEQLLNLGLYFYNSTHHITIANMDDYHKYIKIN